MSIRNALSAGTACAAVVFAIGAVVAYQGGETAGSAHAEPDTTQATRVESMPGPGPQPGPAPAATGAPAPAANNQPAINTVPGGSIPPEASGPPPGFVPPAGSFPPEGAGAEAMPPPQNVYAGFAEPDYDENGDGRIDLREYVDGNVDRLRDDIGWQFDNLDTDGDGTVTRAEYINSQIGGFDDLMRREFDKRDVDGDGKIDPVNNAAMPTDVPPPPPSEPMPLPDDTTPPGPDVPPQESR